MFRRPARHARFIVALALAVSIGAHWVFLQSVAWVGMVVAYSHDSPLPVALAKTFGGRHPCKLCKFVREGQAAEKKQSVQQPVTKIDFVCFVLEKCLFLPEPHQ